MNKKSPTYNDKDSAGHEINPDMRAIGKLIAFGQLLIAVPIIIFLVYMLVLSIGI